MDEGLLDLTAFKTPDPWSRMYRSEALGVKTWDMYDQVIGAFGGKLTPLAAIGGDEDAVRSARKDNRFNPVVLTLKPRTVAPGATDVVKLKLPQYVGSVRVMVVAAHEGAYGKAEKTVAVQSPLMVLTTLPRQLAVGEKVAVPVNVFALEDSVREATVRIEADGPVELAGSSQTVRFDKAGDQLVYFDLKATGEEGVAHIRVSASGASHKASEEIALQVVNPNPVLTRVQRFTLKAGESRRVGEGQLQITGYPAPDAHALFVQMRDYPYDCSEQLSARGLVMVNLLQQLSEADAAEARELIPEIVKRLYARQEADGGFAYWDGGRSDSWVSSMAGSFLAQAAQAGFEVNEGVTGSWLAYQQKLSQAYRVAGSSLFSQADEAFRLYSLAVAGEASLSGMNRLREAGELSSQARWLLSSAYALSGKGATATAVLEGTSREFPEYTPYNLTYGGAERDRYAAMEALVLCGNMAEALSMARVPEHALSTQEAAFAALAYGRLYRKVPTTDVKTSVADGVLRNSSNGPVYVTLSTTTREARQAASNGLSLEVKYTDASGAPVNPAALRQGTRFTAVLKVQSAQAGRDLENLALSYTVPSGWEIVNERLSGAPGSGYDHQDIRDTAVRWYFALPAGRSKTFTVQLRAAYEGKYVLPATVCEALYEPVVNASTAAGTATVSR